MAVLTHPTASALATAVSAFVVRHGGPSKVAAAVGADRTTVHRWMKGNVPIDKLELLAQRLGEPLVLRFGPVTDEEAPPPAWARELTDEIRDEIAQTRELVVSSLAVRTAEALEPHLQQLLDALARLDDHPGA